MSTAASTELSPRATARLYAVLYAITITTGLIAQLGLSRSLIASANAATTAGNIAAHTTAFRAGFTLYMIEMTSQIAMTLVLYSLLKPVNTRVAQLAAALGLTGSVIKIVARLFYYSPLFVLSGSAYLQTFTTEQIDTLALLLLKINDQGAAIALVFFGFAAILEGYLVFRSTFLPRWLGVLSIVGGSGWLTFLWPPLGSSAFNVIAPFALLGSLAMIGWMLVKGVDDERWRAQAALAQSSLWR